MELVLKRDTFTDKSTIGTLSINGKVECFILEDKDRGLTDSMTLEEVNKLKIYGETAIPYGKYEIDITFSFRFKRLLPILKNVKGYEGIRIHTGNKAVDTHGCLLPARKKSIDAVFESTIAFNALFAKLTKAKEAKEKIYITITK
jgi:hypothetical protein